MILPKPKSCTGCPFYQTGMGFVPDLYNPDAEVFIMAQNPGSDEEQGRKLIRYDGKIPVYEEITPEPMIGKTGYTSEREYMPVAGLERTNVSVGNSIRCRVNHTDNLPPLSRPEVKTAIEHCHRAHFKLPPKTKLIVAQGEYALYATTQEGLTEDHKISSWRGYVLPYQPAGTPKAEYSQIYTPTIQERMPVLAMNHVAALYRAPSHIILAKSDWSKIPKILKGRWPAVPPKILRDPPASWPSRFAFDTEFIPESGYMIRYSMGYRTPGTKAITVRVVERDKTTFASGYVEPPALVCHPTIITQNALADIGFFQDLAMIARGDFTIEDIMHIHAVLWAGLPHDLNTFGSLYSSVNRWKHLERINPIVYSGMDAHGTLEAHERLDQELLADPLSRKIYYDVQLKLVDVISRSAAYVGMKVNKVKANQYALEYGEKVEDLYMRAQAEVGWPVNVGSNDQTYRQLYEVEQIQELAFGKPRPKYKEVL